ncbi:MAG TPA: Dyp-type peroxidase [Nocardioidaceae bacterium]|jgi:Dyp-type peroxidase family
MADALELDDIQGLVARGYGRLPHAAYLLAHVEEPTAAGELLRGWAEDGTVTPASESRPSRAMNIAVTADGIRTLTGTTELDDGFAEPFLTGMATAYRSRLLGDVGANDPAGWQWGGPGTDPVHVLVLVYAADAEALATWAADLVSALAGHGMRLLLTLPAAELTAREPFGFRDGISQPLIAGLGSAQREGDVVRDGEFVLGYVNEYSQRTERPLLPTSADPDRLLPRDPDGSGSADLGRNGSYLVFRQLQQDIDGFENYLSRAATVDGHVDKTMREVLAAKLVGRWRGSGAPLVLAPEYDDQALEAANDFGYHQLDPQGLRCPVGAHIRRANPRDVLPPNPGTQESRAVNHRHRLLRRGRAYTTTDETGAATEHGLFFLCLNTNPARQYEFVQHSWVNDPSFNGLVGVEDPLVGPRTNGPGRFDVPSEPVRRRFEGLPQFVTVRGGGYFFLPGIRALRFLTSTPPPQRREEAR